MANWWIKNPQDGNPSVIVTLVVVSFIATTLAYLLSFVQQIGPIQIRAFDVGAATAYFGAVLAAFVGHRWVDTKYGDGTVTNETQPTQGPITP